MLLTANHLKVKRKLKLRTYLELPGVGGGGGGGRDISLHFKHGARWRWMVGATSGRFSPEKRLGTYRTGCWMGRRTGLDDCKKSRLHRDRIPRPSSPWRVAIGTALSRPTGHHLKFWYSCRQTVDVRKTVFALVCFSTCWLRLDHQKYKGETVRNTETPTFIAYLCLQINFVKIKRRHIPRERILKTLGRETSNLVINLLYVLQSEWLCFISIQIPDKITVCMF
jgi:hypothetical protein